MENILSIISTFLPKDFRASLIRMKRERNEASNNAAIERIRRNGSPISIIYEEYWRQQCERRAALVSLGNASGVYKAVITVLGGVPEVLLDFVRRLNDAEGPMEEFRAIYGPNLYFLTSVVNAIHTLCSSLCAWQSRSESTTTLVSPDVSVVELAALLAATSHLYALELSAYIAFLTPIVKSSPFFLTKEEAERYKSNDAPSSLLVQKWATADVVREVRKNQVVHFEFTTKDYDIVYSLSVFPEGQKESAVVVLLPSSRVDSHVSSVKGKHVCPVGGRMVLQFDNSKSWVTDKEVSYRLWL